MNKSRMATLAVAALLVASPVFAQGIQLGVKAGASFATVGGADATDTEMRTGFGVGALASFGVTPMLAIQPEVLFTQKGTETTIEQDVTGTIKLSYLEVPVLAKLSVPTAGGASPYFYAGPAFGYQSGCSIGGEDQGVSIELDCDAIGLELKSVDFSLVGGAGIGFGVGAGQALLDVRYGLGLSTIDDATDPGDIKNRAFSVMLGYAISLGL